MASTWGHQHLSEYLPMDVYQIYRSSIFSPHNQQGTKHDTILFKIPRRFHSYSWPTRSRSFSSKTSLSNYCRWHQLACNLHRPEISPALTYLASYSNAPHQQHYKASINALQILSAPMNMKSNSIPIYLQWFSPLISLPIITKNGPTPKPPHLHLMSATNSPLSATPSGAVNFVVQ